MSDLVTVILTTLNSEKYLRKSIDSCLNQTHHHIELLVVDGGSTDATIEIVESYIKADPRIRLIYQENNAGKLPGAINLGMANARGEYITWTQDDCWYEPDALELMLAFLRDHSRVALVYTDYWLVDNLYGQQAIKYTRVSDVDRMLDEDVIQQCFLFRREVYEAVGPQDIQYFPIHEVPWRLKITQGFRIEPLHIPLQYYHWHVDSLTGRIGGYELQRMMYRAFLIEGHIDEGELRRRLADIDIHDAYAAFVFRGDYRAFRSLFKAAILGNPTHGRNRGLWKLFVTSFLPAREWRRQEMLDAWQAQEAKRQAILVHEFRERFPQRQVAHAND